MATQSVRGTCYEDAWRFLLKEQEGKLLHGSVQTIGKRINHAWVELPTGFVWEPESGEFMKKSYFYERAEPRVQDSYTAEEAAIMAARTGNLGPWSDEERRQFLKRSGNPAFTAKAGLEKDVEGLLPMSPKQGPPLPRGLGITWPWRK